MNFTAKLLQAKQGNIYQVSEKADGRNVYFILLVHEHKLKSFLRIKPGQDYQIADYGKILAWDYGQEPPREILQAIEAKYGVKLKTPEFI